MMNLMLFINISFKPHTKLLSHITTLLIILANLPMVATVVATVVATEAQMAELVDAPVSGTGG